MNTLIVATDGSALNNPNGCAGWAWFIDKDRWDYGSLPKASNQVAELYAIMKALASIPVHIPIKIQTDSNFWVKTIGTDGKSGWMFGWKKKGWKKADGKVPANLQLLLKLDALLSKRRAATTFEWVKGHNGHHLNEIVDRLCTKASASMAKGQAVSGGPGYKNVDPAAPSASRPSVLSVQRSTPNKTRSTAAGATKKRTTPSRRRSAPEYVITSFDDDGPLMPEVKKERSVTYCDSCNSPINMATSECRCSD